MKRAEKILLLMMLALLIIRICGVPTSGAFFTLGSFALALAYLGWGFRLLRTSEAIPVWLAISAGVGLAASMIALPFAMYVRQDLIFKLLPIPNGLVLILLLIRAGVARRKRSTTYAERPLLMRSSTLFVVVAFLSYMPPNAAYRAVIITLNRGNDQLIANMRMVEAFDEFGVAYGNGDCEHALEQAARANREGLTWLFGVDQQEPEWQGTTVDITLSDGTQLELDPMIRSMQVKQRQEQLWKISRTYNNLYQAHQCLALKAEDASDAATAFHHYRIADSLLNVIQDREGYWNEERAWSLRNVARTAATIGDYDLSDSLYNASLDLYADIKDSLDAEAALILADWSRSYASRNSWEYSNYLIRAAIGFGEPDSSNRSTDTRWIRYRLQLVKNLISTDSLSLAARILIPCEEVAHADSSLHCETLLVKGALQYRMNAFRSADTTFEKAVACLSALQHNEAAKAIAYLSWGHVKSALAEYGSARELVTQGQNTVAVIRPAPSLEGGLLQLSALIHHLQGHYLSAREEYEASLDLLASSSNSSDRMPGAMAGLADVLIDLAEPSLARTLADSALAMLVDSLPAIFPSQASVLNTAAYTDYCMSDLEKAQQRYTIVLKACRRQEATSTTTYAQALNGQGLVAMALSRYPTADSLLMQAYAACVSIHGREHPFTAQVMINQAELRVQQRRPEEARALLLSALPTTERFLGKDHDQLGDIHKILGDMDRRSSNRSEAEAHYREALRIYKACFPADHPKVIALAP